MSEENGATPTGDRLSETVEAGAVTKVLEGRQPAEPSQELEKPRRYGGSTQPDLL